jgi:hypothetical protein
MAETKDQLIEKLQTYLAAHEGETLQIKQELDQLFPATHDANVAQQLELTEAISKLKMSHVTKMPKYSKGDNFSRYCERFQEYVQIARINDPALYMYFLNNLDDETYSTLRSITFDPDNATANAIKADAKQFCPIYIRAIYGEESLSLKNELMDSKQSPDQTISDYVYKLREKGSIAYTDVTIAEENCLIAFLRGVRDTQIKRKLNEASIITFKDAISLAKRLERIDNMLNDETEVVSILKSNPNSVSFNPTGATNINTRTTYEQTDGHHSRRSPNYSRRSYNHRSPGRDHSTSPHYSSRNSSYDSQRRDRSSSSNRPYNDRYNNSRDRSSSGNRAYNDRYNNSQDGSSSANRYNNRYNSRNSSGYDNRRNNYRGNNSRSNITCWNCNKIGHVSRNCWSKQTQPTYSGRNRNNMDTQQYPPQGQPTTVGYAVNTFQQYPQQGSPLTSTRSVNNTDQTINNQPYDPNFLNY